MIQDGDDIMDAMIQIGDDFINLPILDDFEYDIVHYDLVFCDDTGYKLVYARSHELFSQEVIEQGRKIAEKNDLGQPMIVEIHEKREILKEVPID